MKSYPIPNWIDKKATFADDVLMIDGYQVMMSWEAPVMHEMASMLIQHTANSILEVGFGMAISASEIQRLGVKQHTIIEPHPEVFQRALQWKKQYPNKDILIVNDFWQSIVDNIHRYDGIFFDTFSPTREEIELKHFHFFKTAADKLLKDNGALCFFHLSPTLLEKYQKELLKYYSNIYLNRVYVSPPDNCEYADDIKGYNYTVCVLVVK